MKNLFCCLFSITFLSFSHTCLKAQSNLDSLYSIWQDNTQTDSTRTYAYYDYIFYGFYHSNPDSAFILSEVLIAFGQENNYPLASAFAYNIQGGCFYIRSNYPQALIYYQRSLEIQKEIGNKKGTATALNNIGNIYETQGNNTQALDYYQRSLVIKEEIGNKRGIGFSLGNIANIYKKQGNYSEALDSYQRSLTISEEIEDNGGITYALLGIGNIYESQGNYPQALDSYQRSLKISEAVGAKQETALTLNNIGNIFYKQSEYPQALDYYQGGLNINNEIGSKSGIASSLNNIGNIYYEQGNYSGSLDNYERSLKISEEIGGKWGVANSVNRIGEIYYLSDRYNDAIVQCKRSLKLSEELGSLEKQKSACSCLYISYKGLDDNTRALDYHERLTILNDSLFNEKNTKKITQLEMQYEFDKKEALVQLTHENEVIELEVYNAKIKTQRNSIVGGSIFLAILGFIGYSFYKIRKDRNDKMAFAEALIFAQENERKRIARDLHDGVGQSLLLIKKQLATTNENTLENNRLINNTLEEVRSISRNLHPFQLEKFGLTTTIRNVIENIEKSTELFISKEIDDIDGAFSQKNDIHYFRVIQEALNNIIKHANASAAKIIIKKSENDIVTKVMDNGKGFDHELTIATSKSLGLRTMNERISTLGGRLKIKANHPSGTIVHFIIQK